jgi:hypothetical protein
LNLKYVNYYTSNLIYMKTKLFSLIFLICFSFICASHTFGQNKYATILKIKELYEQEITREGNKYVSFDFDKKQLTLSEYVINISEDTKLEYIRSRENGETVHQVQFFCQNGTTIIDKTDLDKKRAWLALDFKSREACHEFIALLKKMKV